MNVTIDQMHRAIMTFAEEEIAAKAVGFNRFATYFLIGSLANRPDKTVGALLDTPFIKMTDIVDSDGSIKADELYSAARGAMDKCHSITLAGITFTSADIDKLYTILQRG